MQQSTLLTVMCDSVYSTVCHYRPFPQIDIIGAMLIVWRVRGKIIRSVLCNIVCNNCAQCTVSSNWAHFTVLRFIFVYVKCMYFLCDCMYV